MTRYLCNELGKGASITIEPGGLALIILQNGREYYYDDPYGAIADLYDKGYEFLAYEEVF